MKNDSCRLRTVSRAGAAFFARAKSLRCVCSVWERLFCVALAIAIGAVDSASRAAPPGGFLTGEELRKAHERPLTVAWLGGSLRKSLESLSQAQRVAILLDRRVDPDQRLQLAIENLPLDVTLKMIASKQRLGFSQLGPVAYYGPTATAEKLRTVAALRREEALKAPTGTRAALVRSQAWKWSDLATPQELLAALATEAKVRIVNPELIPHDLWAGVELPPLAWSDRLTLVVAQFDLTFEIAPDGKSIRLVSIPAEVLLERKYPASAEVAAAAANWPQKYPKSKFSVAGAVLTVMGPAEDIEMVEASLQGKTMRRVNVAPGTQVYQLEVKNAPLGRMLQELARKLDRKITIDQASMKAAGVSLETPVSFSVKNATLDELMQAVVGPVGLRFTREGNAITVHGRKP